MLNIYRYSFVFLSSFFVHESESVMRIHITYDWTVIVLSLEAIKQISETEQTAQKHLADAQAAARDIITSAQKIAAEVYDTALKQAALQAAQALADARQRGEDFAAKQLSEYRRSCEELQAQAKARMDSAVAIVMERVVG